MNKQICQQILETVDGLPINRRDNVTADVHSFAVELLLHCAGFKPGLTCRSIGAHVVNQYAVKIDIQPDQFVEFVVECAACNTKISVGDLAIFDQGGDNFLDDIRGNGKAQPQRLTQIPCVDADY